MVLFQYYPVICFFAILFSHSNAQIGFILPIQKDTKTSQFYTTIELGSNRIPMNAVIDLGAQSAWFGCENYTSLTYAPIPCGSNKCEVAKGLGCMGCNGPFRPGCSNDTCGASGFNPFQDVLVAEGFAEDTLSSRNQRSVNQFIFNCMESRFMEGIDDMWGSRDKVSNTFMGKHGQSMVDWSNKLNDGIAHGTNGMIGLARTEISLHKHVANKFKLPDRFFMCLPSSGVGKLSIGGASASTISRVSKSLKATPLIINPVSTAPAYTVGDPSDEYFIDVKTIRVAGESLSVRSSYFSIDKEGVGGTKISTINNYTALHNSIYKPFARAFSKAASDMKIKSVNAVSPFRACFSSKTIAKTPTGPSVPTIDLVLPGKDVHWRINGANSMVEIDRNTMCLAFVDGGSNPRTSIVIGVHQLEENLLEFDLVSSQLRFSSSLLVQNTKCSRL